MKDTFYFSHDYNARYDDKIRQLIRNTGMKGYGIFWAIIEDLYNNANAMRTDYEGIAFDLRVDKNTVQNIINNYDLFVIKNEYFSSDSVQRRLDERDSKSVKARESALKRWGNATALRPHCEGNAIKERKGKERKENNIVYEPDFLNEFGWIADPETFEGIKTLYPKLLQLKRPLTFKEHTKLVDKWGINSVRNIYRDLEAWADLLTKRSWAAGTADGWLQRNKEPKK